MPLQPETKWTLLSPLPAVQYPLASGKEHPASVNVGCLQIICPKVERAAGISLTSKRMEEGMRKAQGGRYHYIRCYVSVGDVRSFST